MIGNDHLEPKGPSLGHGVVGQDPAIHGDHHVSSAVRTGLEARVPEPVAVVEPVGYEVFHIRTQ